MLKRIITIIMAIFIFTLFLTGCKSKSGNTDAVDQQIYCEVTDLQLVLLNSILYNDSLTQLEGKSVENHDELINNNYKEHISRGDYLVNELKGYTLIDYDYGDISGFKAAAFTKGNNLVIVYGGTDHPTDFVDDVFSGLFDFSAQDGQAKAFSKDNVKKHKDYDLYITGYSLGGRLCYLGTEDVIDAKLGDKLKKVRTFNGLGVKEALDLTDNNLSNIHNLEAKFGDKTYDYIVDGDSVSDGDLSLNFRDWGNYVHVGTELKVPCTNEIDTGLMKEHDLYSIIDYLLNNPEPGATTDNHSEVSVKEPTSVPTNVPTDPPTELDIYADFLIGDWSTSDGVFLSFYDDGYFEMEWSYFPPEEGEWYAEAISDDTYYIEMDGSLVLSLMSMIYGSADTDYHFEILKRDDNSFYLVQVYGEYTAESSPCKLSFTRE